MRWTELRLGELQRRIDNGISVTELATMYNLTRGRVYQIIAFYGLKLKNT
jgi:Mor family transcriptional regulator